MQTAHASQPNKEAVGGSTSCSSHNLHFWCQVSFNKGLCPVGPISRPDKHFYCNFKTHIMNLFQVLVVEWRSQRCARYCNFVFVFHLKQIFWCNFKVNSFIWEYGDLYIDWNKNIKMWMRLNTEIYRQSPVKTRHYVFCPTVDCPTDFCPTGPSLTINNFPDLNSYPELQSVSQCSVLFAPIK